MDITPLKKSVGLGGGFRGLWRFGFVPRQPLKLSNGLAFAK